MNIKKALTLTLAALTLCASLAACGGTAAPESKPAPSASAAPAAEEKIVIALLEQNSIEMESTMCVAQYLVGDDLEVKIVTDTLHSAAFPKGNLPHSHCGCANDGESYIGKVL